MIDGGIDTGNPTPEASVDTGPPVDTGVDAGVPTKDVFIMRELFLGDTDRSFVASVTAWRDFGLDIDGKTTTMQSNDVCQRVQGAPSSVQVDGTYGIDNSFGANIVPIFQAVSGQADLSKPASDAIEMGVSSSVALRIDGVGTAQDYPMLSGAFYKAFGPTPPTWQGMDPWGASSRSVLGSLDSPIVTFPKGTMTGRTYYSGVSAKTVASLEIDFGGAGLVLPLRHFVIKTKVAGDNSATTEGIISAVMNTEEFVAAMKQLLGQISMSLCMGSTFDGIAQQIRQASDILDDGTQDPQKTCNAISIGLGFEAVSAKLTAIVTDPSPPMPCP
jgi:hypothetical protein